MRVVSKANVVITDGTDNRDTLFGPDDEIAVSTLDGFLESAHGREDLANAAVFTVPLSELSTPYGFFIRSTGNFNLIINGHTGGAFQIRKGIAGPLVTNVATYARILMEMQVTSLQLTMQEAGQVLWAAWGKPIT